MDCKVYLENEAGKGCKVSVMLFSRTLNMKMSYATCTPLRLSEETLNILQSIGDIWREILKKTNLAGWGVALAEGAQIV